MPRRRRPTGNLLTPLTTMWQPLTEDIIAEGLNPSEQASITVGRASCPQDPVAGILAGVAATIRSRIASGGRTRLRGSEMDIPIELMPVASALVRHQLLLRFALAVGDDRRAAFDDANKTLRELSAGQYVITDDVTNPTPKPFYTRRPSRWGIAAADRRRPNP